MRYRTGFGGWLRGPQSLLWLAAVMLYGIGDLLTTTVGLRQRDIVEVGPVAAPVVAQYGTVGLVVLKCWLLLGSYLLWRAIPTGPTMLESRWGWQLPAC